MKSSKQTLELPISGMKSWDSECRLSRGKNPRSADHYDIMRSNLKSREELKEKGLQIKSIKCIFPNRLEKLKKISKRSEIDSHMLLIDVQLGRLWKTNWQYAWKSLEIHVHLEPATTRIHPKETMTEMWINKDFCCNGVHISQKLKIV